VRVDPTAKLLAANLLLSALLPAHGQSATKVLRDAQLEDLEIAQREYALKSKAFTPERRKRALTLLESLKTRAGTLSNPEFLVGIDKIAALAENGHDGSATPGDHAWTPAKRLPLRLIWFPDGLVVARAPREQADLIGARVISIEGLSPSVIFSRLRILSGGTDIYRSWDAMWAIEWSEILYTLGMARAPDRLRFRLVLPTGQRVYRTIADVPARSMPPGTHPKRWWSPVPIAGEAERGWKAAGETAHLPLYLQDPDAHFRMVNLPDMDALYVQFRSNVDSDGHPIKPFVAEVRQEIETHHPVNLIYDLRFNTGGDITETRDFIRSIPANVSGRIYVLIGRFTFSAGIVSAAALKHDGGDRVILVGEDVGDRLRFWSEGEPVCLPNSDLFLHPTTGLWNLEKGCKGEPNCYGDQFDATVGTLKPKLRAPLTAGAWLAGKDPGMEAIRGDLAKPFPARHSPSQTRATCQRDHCK
jgi:hypothetical protein